MSAACPTLAGGPDGIAAALRTVDCLSADAGAVAFARLFGADGALGTALTLALTLLVGLFAFGLLTGRARLGLSALTPRAFALGLALTFATSWVAYQSVVWNLAVGAPDQVAGIVAGTRGSATMAFADRLDAVFGAVADAATAAQAGEGDATPKAAGFTPADVLWLGALLLLLGTVGVLLTARIALAALLALGPVFIVLSLFRGTRGLFEGWLKGMALFAVTPLFAVTIGGGALALIGPVVASLAGSEIDMRAAVTVLLAAVVYCALMGIVLKVSVTLTAGWRLPGQEPARAMAGHSASMVSAPSYGAVQAAALAIAPPGRPPADERVRAILAGVAADTPDQAALASPDRARPIAAAASAALPAPASALAVADGRARGIGSQFRLPPPDRETLPC